MDENRDSHELPGIDAGKATDESVIRVHAQIRRSSVPGSPVTFFTMIALVIVFVFGWFYVRRYSAHYDSHGYLASREDQAALQRYIDRPKGDVVPEKPDGAKLYAQQCVACHQAAGQGLAGAFPPLAGSEWVINEPELPVKILLAGLSGEITVKGNTYNGAMPAFGAVFNDAEIAAVVTYIRGNWDNGASEVTEEQVTAVRESIGSRGPWSAAELK